MNTIDARGYSCPQPVIMTKKALSSGEKTYTILVDSFAAKENVSRFAIHAGYQVACTESEDRSFTLTLSR